MNPIAQAALTAIFKEEAEAAQTATPPIEGTLTLTTSLHGAHGIRLDTKSVSFWTSVDTDACTTPDQCRTVIRHAIKALRAQARSTSSYSVHGMSLPIGVPKPKPLTSIDELLAACDLAIEDAQAMQKPVVGDLSVSSGYDAKLADLLAMKLSAVEEVTVDDIKKLSAWMKAWTPQFKMPFQAEVTAGSSWAEPAWAWGVDPLTSLPQPVTSPSPAPALRPDPVPAFDPFASSSISPADLLGAAVKVS